MRIGQNSSSLSKKLLATVCFAALSAGTAAPAWAQDTPKAEEDEVVVTGQRANLDSAQNRKRDADTVVDSITATDIGSFPDKSVAEALQRVPGVTVVRFAGTDDTSHFSAEPSGVIVRGLPQVRSEFNGRDTFSANSSRGLSWQDISPELLSGIDTYKNQTADMVEGGIAGTINLRTRLPFDSKKDVISIGVMGNYGDISKRVTPEVSGVITKQWDTGAGTFGVMLNGAYSQVETGSQGVQFDRIAIFAPGAYGPGTRYIPNGIYMRDNVYDRKRIGLAGALQWRSTDGTMEATAQYTRSQYKNSWREHSVYSSAGNSAELYGRPTDHVYTDGSLIAPLQGKPAFTFDDDGNFTSGWWSSQQPYVGEGGAERGLGLNANDQAFYPRCYSWEGCTNSRRAPQVDTASNALRNKQYTQDFTFNFKWSPSDRVHLSFDAQYVDSQVHNYNASVTSRTYANTFVDLTGKYPTLEFTPTVADNIGLSAGGLTNPNNYHYYAITDHTEDSNGNEIALRADVEYEIDTPWLSALKIGGRYADRDQTVRWGAYNWANISNNWTYTQAPYFNMDKPIYGSGSNESFTFGSDFFAGNQMNHNEFRFFNMDKLENRDQLAASLGRPAIGVGDYYPVCSNGGYRAGETVKGEYGCYLPNEVLKLSETTAAGYAMLKFGGPDAKLGSVGISGNIGGRLIFTVNETAGALTFPSAFTPTQLLCERGVAPGSGLPTATAGCVTGADEIAFGNGSFVPNVARQDHLHFLPSFNLKVDFTDKLVSRFAYSKAISRPDVGLLRNFTTITRLSPGLTDRTNPDIVFGPDGQTIVGYNWRYRGQAGNPYLKPIEADQFDVTLEYYFGRASSFTATGFLKKFNNYIQSGTYNLNVINNGVSRNVLVTGPQNGDGASIKGAEVAFQTFFDFLPGLLSGFGVQANYTYVDNSGIETINLTNETAGGTAGGGVSYDSTAVKAKALEGISTHSYNLVAMYEKGPVSARVAYNWRSEYLVTAIDCCVGLPIWQGATGYLDASLRIRFIPQAEFIVQASNLLGTDTVLYQQVDNTGLLKPNAWFKNDRRIQAGIRITM
ncbi:MAG: TonB-dependent receptor [Sphingomonadales bacterium]|nr:MAG: TonB-dependent receptor [Sphingomonadales bacterium]